MPWRGLDTAYGLRVFFSLLLMSIAVLIGWFEPMRSFKGLAILFVGIAWRIAIFCEIATYYMPWGDNVLDTIATPAKRLAGTLTSMVVSGGAMSQFASWAKAIIVGSGTAGTV